MKKLAILLAALFCLCVFAATAEQAGHWQGHHRRNRDR